MGIHHSELALPAANAMPIDGMADTLLPSELPTEHVYTPGVVEDLTDAVALFKQDIGDLPLLTRAEEAALAQKIQVGHMANELLQGEEVGQDRQNELQQEINVGRSARNELVKRNLPLVLSFCKKYVGRGIRMEDLIQEANLGMIRAADTYDPSKGGFANHATWLMRGFISNAFRRHKTLHPVPEYSLNALVEDEEIAVEIPDPAGVAEYEAAEYRVMAEEVRNTAARVLNQREFEIYRYRNEFDFTCAETGERMGLSRKRISAIDIEIRTKLLPQIYVLRDVVADHV